MTMMHSTFPYYGGRYNQLRKIIEILESHKDQFDVIVDVFGGSGKVLLNIPDEWRKVKVYNDINKDLYVTFKVLQDNVKRSQVERKLRNCFAHEAVFQEMKRSNPRSDVEIAFKTIYLHTFSFSGAGKAFKRSYKRINVRPVRTEDFLLVKKWVVENMDFRDLMSRYNRERVLLYLDPPYLRGGGQYRYSFTMDDFVELKKLVDVHSGTHLLNLSMTDPEMIGIFGQPDLVTEHSRPTTMGTKKEGNVWGCGYWWKLD
ncbi:MAG: DNA adenine methylase [Thermoplasmataceae archaeon]